ncbi:MAG: Npt1/Npt2 family nucleotide transporter [Mariprofundus sp.]|nr:Npt1/Npt2 family nucleotide transporter [Mariprofundus sp.]
MNYFLIIAALYQLKPASRSIFIDQVGSEHLPYVWIATALTLGIIISYYNRLVARFSRIHVVIGTVTTLLALLALFRLLLTAPSPVSAFSFYIFVDILSVLLVEQFWSLTNAINSEKDGHRWYAMIGTGGLLGGVIGGMGAHALITYTSLNTLDLLYVAGIILITLLSMTLLMQRCGLYHEHPSPMSEKSNDPVDAGFWHTIVKNHYLSLIAALLLLSQVIEPLVEYQFMNAVETAFDNREERTAYLGFLFSLLSAVAIGINLILTPLIHRRLGAIAGLALQPISVAFSTLFFIASPALVTAAAVKISDRALSYSINRASKELLYIPIDPVLIFQAKAWIDMFGYRVFKILGSVMILLLTQWLWFSISVSQIGYLSLIVCATWGATLISVNREYRKISTIHPDQ